MKSGMTLNSMRLHTFGCLFALIALGIATELWLAPLRPGGSWLVLKVLPLALCLRGVWLARRYTFQALSLLIWIYFAEGCVRASTDQGESAAAGGLSIALTLAIFALCVGYARSAAPSKLAAGKPAEEPGH